MAGRLRALIVFFFQWSYGASSAADYALPRGIVSRHSEGLRPSDSPTGSLASRFADSLRFRLRESYGETSPKRLRRDGGRLARFAALARVFVRAALL